MSGATVTTSRKGRHGPATKKATILLDPQLLEWGKHQPGGLSGLVRNLLREAQERSVNSDAYWIRLGETGRASGHASPEETMQFIQERLERDEQQ